jgi:predicted ester cyclase
MREKLRGTLVAIAALAAVAAAGCLAGPAFARQSEPVPEPPAAVPQVGEATMAANKALVRRYIEEVLSRGDLRKLDELVAPDYADASPGAEEGMIGPELVRAAQQRVRSLFSGVSYRIDLIVAEGDTVVARYGVRAVYQPKKPDAEGVIGREIGIGGMTIFRLAAGRIQESWTINDQMEMFRQLGYELTPPPKLGKTEKPGKLPS